MKSVIFLAVFLLSCLQPLLLVWPQVSGESDPQQMLDFSLSGYGSGGRKSWQVEGASMDILDNLIEITTVKAHLFGSEEDMVLTSDRGSFDKDTGVVRLRDNVEAVTDGGTRMNTQALDWSQKEQLVSSEDYVTIKKGNMTASAQGMKAHPDFKVAELEKDVMVTIQEQGAKAAGSDPKQMSKIVITCDGPMDLNYENQMAVFHKNVKMEGDAQQGTMYADRMTIYFDSETQSLERMEAQGHVRIVRGENTSFSESAVFIGSDRKLTLTGRPKLVLYTEEALDASP